MLNKIKNHIEKIYTDNLTSEQKEELSNNILKLVNDAKSSLNIRMPEKVSQKDSYMIAYGDSFQREGEKPLKVMKEFYNEYLKGIMSEIHILPHFPFSSDDGFSVIDYEEVNPNFGDWDDIKELAKDSNLMFDYVINHISSESKWFKEYLEGNPKYAGYFVEKEDWDYSNVVRPRTSDLFHDFFTKDGSTKSVWTTFSRDQIDLNFREPKVMEESVRILLKYISMGMSSIRLDAIGFLWKEDGATCIHLQPTHEVIKLWRTVMDEISPNYKIITETNVPFLENISYFGDNDEAHMVYQFPLPPLTAHTMLTGDATKLTNWAKTLDFINGNKNITFFNFLASHDGIGMRPAEGILNDDEVENLRIKTLEKGGETSNRTNGTKETVYELNINYFSLLKENDEYDVNRFIAAQFILLSLIGVPAIYYHSIVGSENHRQGFVDSGIKRRVNREKLQLDELSKELKNPETKRYEIFNTLKKLLNIRSKENAFDPYGDQHVLELSSKLFAIRRVNDGEEIISIVNISNESVTISSDEIVGKDIISGNNFNKEITLNPYQFVWIKK